MGSNTDSDSGPEPRTMISLSLNIFDVMGLENGEVGGVEVNEEVEKENAAARGEAQVERGYGRPRYVGFSPSELSKQLRI